MQQLGRQVVMTLRFIGKDPDSPNNGSPTVWLDEADGSIVIHPGLQIQRTDQGRSIRDDLETLRELLQRAAGV